MDQANRHKKPRSLSEPFRSFREIELLIERARACYCFCQHRALGRSLRDIAKELGMSYERVRHLAERGEKVYGLDIKDYARETGPQTDIDEVEGADIMTKEALTVPNGFK